MAWWNKPKEQESEEETKQEEVKKEEEPNSGFVSREDFNKVNERLEQLTNAMLGNQPSQQAPAQQEPEPEIEDASDEEIQAAWAKADETGEATDIRNARVLESKRSAANQKRLEHSFNKQIKGLEAQGSQWISGVNQRQAKSYLEGKKYYKEYKKEIDEALGQVDPTYINPELAEKAYNMVVGTHFEEIRDKEAEAEARQKAAKASDTTGRTGREQEEVKQPGQKFEETFGESVSSPGARWEGGGDLWSSRHRNPDEFAYNLGYQSADDYAEASEAIMSVEDCPNCFSPMTEKLGGGEHKCPVPSATHKLSLPGLR